MRQEYKWPLSDNTVYQLPVDFVTLPVINANVTDKANKRLLNLCDSKQKGPKMGKPPEGGIYSHEKSYLQIPKDSIK